MDTTQTGSLSFFSFSSLALIHLAEQPIRTISVTTKPHSHRPSLEATDWPMADQEEVFLLFFFSSGIQ